MKAGDGAAQLTGRGGRWSWYKISDLCDKALYFLLFWALSGHQRSLEAEADPRGYLVLVAEKYCVLFEVICKLARER